MKLMMFEKAGGAALGLVEGASVIDLGAADASLPKDLAALIAAGPAALDKAKAAAAKAPASAKFALASVKAALPIARPPSSCVCPRHSRRPVRLCCGRRTPSSSTTSAS